MPNPKRKGSDWEREIVTLARAHGLEAERAWGSNGKALGESEQVDVLVHGMRVQAKRRKHVADFLQIPKSCDAVFFRQDRGESLVLLRLSDLLDKLEQGW